MKKVFAVWDTKVETYVGTPIFLATKGEALRQFLDVVKNKVEGNMIAKHPEDYSLFELGEYDEKTGYIKSHPAPANVANAWELVDTDFGSRIDEAKKNFSPASQA